MTPQPDCTPKGVRLQRDGEVIDVAVIGAGYWGSKHIRAYQNMPSVRLSFICDIDKKKLNHYKNAICVKDYKKLVDYPSIKAVSIVVPDEIHYEIAKFCLTIGKHVLLEKPMTLSSSQASKLIQLARERNLVLATGHVYSFDPVILKLRNLVQNDYFGELQFVGLYWKTLYNSRKKTDILFDLGYHPVQVLDFAFGLYPKRIDIAEQSHSDKSKMISIMGRANGTAIHMELSWLFPKKTREIYIIGKKKSIVANCVEKTITVLKTHTNDKLPLPNKFERLAVESLEPLSAELNHFIESIKSPCGDVQIPGMNGAEILRLLEGVHKKRKHQRETRQEVG